MNDKRFALIGASGRMGQEILALSGASGMVAALGVARGEVLGFPRAAAALDEAAKLEADVVIDFSLPAATVGVANWCRENGVPLVSGVTGIGPAERAALEQASQRVAVLWAPNMSLGVAVMARMMQSWSALAGL